MSTKKGKKGQRASKRVDFVIVFCGINTNIMYEPNQEVGNDCFQINMNGMESFLM